MNGQQSLYYRTIPKRNQILCQSILIIDDESALWKQKLKQRTAHRSPLAEHAMQGVQWIPEIENTQMLTKFDKTDNIPLDPQNFVSFVRQVSCWFLIFR